MCKEALTECRQHQGAPRSRGQHIGIERFIADVNRRVLSKIIDWRCDGNPEAALKIALGSFEELLAQKERDAKNPCANHIKRRITIAKTAWLREQVEKLKKRVDFIDRMKCPV